MKKETGARSDICGKLQFKSVRGIKRLQFILLEYRFFGDGEEGSALPVDWSRFLSPLSLLLHIVKSRALSLLKLPCYFVKLEKETVGLLAIQEHQESMLVASLGVAKEYRRLGIGTLILCYIEKIARRMSKSWLEVDVLSTNTSAQRLYTRYGFTFAPSRGERFIMRGKKHITWKIAMALRLS